MADAGGTTNGLDALQQRMARGRRTVPPPRRTADELSASSGPEASALAAPTTVSTTPAPESEPPVPTASAATPSAPFPSSVSSAAAVLPADEPLANLMVRVRRSLDLRLDHLIHELRRQENLRTNKTELVEMLLWELPDEPGRELTERLRRYRSVTPRR